jgi:S-adenosylmethionine decarboxylase
MKNLGIEIVGDLKGIDNIFLVHLKTEELKIQISTLIKKYGFHELGSYYHSFEPGITGAVVLAESHIAFHTWPEFGYVSLNVFTCNYTKDNDDNAKSLFDEIAILFRAPEIDKQIVMRNH